MRPENEPLTNGDAIHHDDSAMKKDVERETKALSLNVATSTPSIPIPGKMIANGTNGISNSTSTDEGHSPSLLPVSVQWLGQNPNLLGKFLEYYKREQFCDCLIWCQEKSFRAHRIILAAVSGFFRRIFLRTDVEGPHNVILNDSVSPADISQMLDIIYKGSVDAHREDIAAILHCARYLEIHGITLDNLKIVDKLGNVLPISDEDVEGSDSGYRGTLGDSGMAVDWHSGSSEGRRWSESPRTGSNESAEMRNAVISSSNAGLVNGNERVPSRESNKSSREGKGRRKGYRPNRIRTEDHLDQHEATDLTSKRRDSIHMLDNSHSRLDDSHQMSKTPRMDTSSSLSKSPKPSTSKASTLNIRSDLRKHTSALDSTNLMASLNKGLQSYGTDASQQALHWLNGHSGSAASTESQAAAILAASNKKNSLSIGTSSDRENSEKDVPSISHGVNSQTSLQQTLGISEGSDFSQRLHQAFLMQVMNQEALRNAATGNGTASAAQAASVYNNAALAAAGGYNAQHWAAMLGMGNGLTGSHAQSSTSNSGLHTGSSAFSGSKQAASSPQRASPPPLTASSALASYHAKNAMMSSSPSMVPHSTIPQMLGSDSPQNGGLGGMYESPPIRMGSGRGRGSSGRKVHQLVGENGRPYVKCDICGKCLADPSSLYRHRKIHNGEKPHTCRFCQRKFIQRYNMTQHIKTHFKEKGANSLLANGELQKMLERGELSPDEIRFFMEFTQGHKRFEDPDNPFLRTEDGQAIADEGDVPPHLDREGSPEPEYIDDDDEEGEMIIDEDPVDHSFTSRLAEASPVLSSKPNNESEKDITTNGTIDA